MPSVIIPSAVVRRKMITVYGATRSIDDTTHWRDRPTTRCSALEIYLYSVCGYLVGHGNFFVPSIIYEENRRREIRPDPPPSPVVHINIYVRARVSLI